MRNNPVFSHVTFSAFSNVIVLLNITENCLSLDSFGLYFRYQIAFLSCLKCSENVFECFIFLNVLCFCVLAMKMAKWETQILTPKKEAFTKRSYE